MLFNYANSAMVIQNAPQYYIDLFHIIGYQHYCYLLKEYLLSLRILTLKKVFNIFIDINIKSISLAFKLRAWLFVTEKFGIYKVF